MNGLTCKVCNRRVLIVRRASTNKRFNGAMLIRQASKCFAVHADGIQESLKITQNYARELKRKLEDSCQRIAEIGA